VHFFLGFHDELGFLEALLKAPVVTFQFRELARQWINGASFAAALSRREPVENTLFALTTPADDAGRIEAFATQKNAELAPFRTGIRLSQNFQLVGDRKPSARPI